jgi:hypothetical protein
MKMPANFRLPAFLLLIIYPVGGKYLSHKIDIILTDTTN